MNEISFEEGVVCKSSNIDMSYLSLLSGRFHNRYAAEALRLAVDRMILAGSRRDKRTSELRQS